MDQKRDQACKAFSTPQPKHPVNTPLPNLVDPRHWPPFKLPRNGKSPGRDAAVDGKDPHHCEDVPRLIPGAWEVHSLGKSARVVPGRSVGKLYFSSSFLTMAKMPTESSISP